MIVNIKKTTKEQILNILILVSQLVLVIFLGILFFLFKSNFSGLFSFIVLFLLIIFIATSFFYFFTLKKQINRQKKAEDELSDLNKNLEQKVQERTKVLEESEVKIEMALKETERINKLMVGRELEMIKLKKEIIDLKNKLFL